MKTIITLTVMSLTLIFITGCSGNKVVFPPTPSLGGDCRKDLDNIVKYYVVPLETQRK